MKLTLALITPFGLLTSANIMFNFVQPTCEHGSLSYTGCLRGQQCLPDNTSVHALILTTDR